MHRKRPPSREHADIDITGLLNIMIVLVPVLLMGLVFSQITVLNLKLPEGGAGGPVDLAQEEIELVVRAGDMLVNFPRGTLLKTIPPTAAGEPDYTLLSQTLQEVKRLLIERGIEKRAITILSEPDIGYQQLVTTIDTVRSYEALIATSVVDAELFPDVTFGDAPVAPALAGVKP
jgi:biopolymer transport protein ExbD